MENMHRSLKLFTGFAIGSAIGAGVALLFAPASGEETRYKIKTEIGDAQRKAMLAVEDVQHKARIMADNAKLDVQDRVERLKNIGGHVFEEQKASLEQGALEAKDVLKE